VFLLLYVGHTGELCKKGWTDRDAVWGLTHSRKSKKPLLDGSRSPREGHFLGRGMCQPIVTYIRMANVPAPRTRRTNAFTASRGDETAMRPLAKLGLLWTLVNVNDLLISFLKYSKYKNNIVMSAIWSSGYCMGCITLSAIHEMHGANVCDIALYHIAGHLEHLFNILPIYRLDGSCTA